MKDLYHPQFSHGRTMLFADGENFAMRYGGMLKKRGLTESPVPPIHGAIWHEPNVALWAQFLNPHPTQAAHLVRRYFYTSVGKDQPEKERIETWLKDRNFEAPRVFHRDKERGSKQVDITLTTEMLTHAHRRHYDTAILIAGDADYVPLVRAVRGEGARVHIWAFTEGLSDRLAMEADYFVPLDEHFGLG